MILDTPNEKGLCVYFCGDVQKRSKKSMVLIFGTHCLHIVYFRWTPAWGDTTVIVGSHLGQQLGNWLNFQVINTVKELIQFSGI